MITKLTDHFQHHHDTMVDATISYMLIHLGIRYKMRGFRYLRYAIKLVHDDPDTYYELITKHLYPDVAKYFDSTPLRIERSMRYAIESMACTQEVKEEVFGYAADGYTNREFIIAVTEAIWGMEQQIKRGV